MIFVAGYFHVGMLFEEEDACAVYANYRQVRQYLHKKALGRGFQKPKPPGKTVKKTTTKSKSTFTKRKSIVARPKRWTKEKLMSRTKCARCGQIGHWARTCSNPSDERGKKHPSFNGVVSSQYFMTTISSGVQTGTQFHTNNSRIPCTT